MNIVVQKIKGIKKSDIIDITKFYKNGMLSCKTDILNAEKEVKTIDRHKIEEYTNDLKSVQSEQQELFEDRETLAIAANMLKDGGIKAKIISQYIPIMNKLINKYLSSFDLFVDFQLDENFNEVIKSRFRDTFSYSSFSEGEKLRINLSLLFTWRAVAKMRNSVSTNLLIMDEVLDSGSDQEGVNSLIDIVNKMEDSNVFVISHRGELFGELFNSHLQFEKVKNFSQMNRISA